MIISEYTTKNVRLVFRVDTKTISVWKTTKHPKQEEQDFFTIKIHDQNSSYTLLETQEEDKARECWSLLSQTIVGD